MIPLLAILQELRIDGERVPFEGYAQRAAPIVVPADPPEFRCDALILYPDPPPGAVAQRWPIAPTCRLAIETDYELFALFGSGPATAAYVLDLVQATSDQFFRDLRCTLTVVYIGIHTLPDDGWVATTKLDRLYEFQAAWSAGWPATADLAHFLSGAPLGGGIAYINVLCNPAYGFGLSADLSGIATAPGWDRYVFAHELGHGFGSLHTHDYCPPLDRCQPPTFPGCGPPDALCMRGTLMSYCGLCPGGPANIDYCFHPYTASIMRSRIEASCLARAVRYAR